MVTRAPVTIFRNSDKAQTKYCTLKRSWFWKIGTQSTCFFPFNLRKGFVVRVFSLVWLTDQNTVTTIVIPGSLLLPAWKSPTLAYYSAELRSVAKNACSVANANQRRKHKGARDWTQPSSVCDPPVQGWADVLGQDQMPPIIHFILC